MENVKDHEQATYEGQKKREPRTRWSAMWPESLVEAIRRYSDESGVTQVHFVKKATEKALREVGAL